MSEPEFVLVVGFLAVLLVTSIGSWREEITSYVIKEDYEQLNIYVMILWFRLYKKTYIRFDRNDDFREKKSGKSKDYDYKLAQYLNNLHEKADEKESQLNFKRKLKALEKGYDYKK